MTETMKPKPAPIPAPPVKEKPATREEIVALLSGGKGDFQVTIKA